MPQSVFKPNWLLSICNWEEIHMNGHVAKLAMGGSFGIALLGLYLIFNSTGTPMSLAACGMYVVGAVVGVILSWSAANA
jgi:hypothetical protein